MTDSTQHWEFYASGVTFGTGVTTGPLGLRGAGPTAAGAMEVPLKDAIKAGDSVSVWVAGATNPGAGTVADFEVYTTSNTAAGHGAPYTVLTLADSIGGTSCLLPPDPACYSPQAFRTAYGISQLLAKGIDGQGRTVVLLEGVGAVAAGEGGDANIFQDMSVFDTYFHLPPVKLTVVPGRTPKASADLSSTEEFEDIEMVHVIAPRAAIRVVLAEDNAGTTLVTMLSSVLPASRGTDVVSISFQSPEDCLTTAQLAEGNSLISQLAARHITVVAVSGDTGVADFICTGTTVVDIAKRGVEYPASSPLVLGVGGTTLAINPKTDAWLSETAWDDPGSGSGGGFSGVFARPPYQDGVPGIGAHRGVPDVAADAGPSGLALIDSYEMTTATGTSAGAPFWAGLIALADQYAGRDLGLVNPAIYRVAQSANYHAAFHDIVKGDNSMVVAGKTVQGYEAGLGWDPVTGWGTPIASVLVPLLARYDGS